MNIKSPFSLYDFIGYFFPGFISISIFIIYYSCCNDMVLKLSDFSTFNINNDDDIFMKEVYMNSLEFDTDTINQGILLFEQKSLFKNM